MKKTSRILLTLMLICSRFLTSCGISDLNKKAETVASGFYHNIQQKDYNAALNLCSSRAFTADSKNAWTKALERNAVLMGELQSFTRATSGFNIQSSTGRGTTVSMVYDVQWQYGKSLDSVILVKEDDGSMKVYRYEWKTKEAKYLSQVEASENSARQYMQAVQSGNYDAALSLCSDAALIITPKVKWEGFLNNAKTKLGNIDNYAVIKDSSMFHVGAKGNAGNGNYYDIYIQTDRSGNKVMEKVIFFQKNYDQPVKVAGHIIL